jgi:mono/diheme cytochrome c family protein
VEDLAQGRALYVEKCSGCHNLHLPAEYSPEEWKSYVAYMVAEAKITPAEQAAIARFLAASSARSRGLDASAGASTEGGR